MTYFDKLLEARGMDKCPYPIWKLKLTGEEYSGLKGYLKEALDDWNLGKKRENSFDREAALYYSEYHQREYVNGDSNANGPKAAVFNSLGYSESESFYRSMKAAFENAAFKSGAKRIGAEIYKGNKGNEYCFSLLYNGGLPLKKITGAENIGTWQKLIKYLFECDEKMQFDDEIFGTLVNGIIASHIDALKSFCQQLQDAIITEDYTAMPFYCESEEDIQYKFFIEQGRTAEKQIRLRNPFHIDWSFEILDNIKIVKPKYDISGPKKIEFNSPFLETYQSLSNSDSFTIVTMEDGQKIRSNRYKRTRNDFYTPDSLHISGDYNGISTYSVICQESESVFASEYLDTQTPQLIRRGENGRYIMSSNRHIGHKEVRIIIPEGWTVENAGQYDISEGYRMLDQNVSVLTLKSGVDKQEVVLTNESGERKRFAANLPLSRIIVKNCGQNDCLKQSAYFNVKNLNYFIVSDEGREKRISRENLLFCSDRRTGNWTEEPELGYIFVKPKNESIYADPVQILNLGTDKNEFRVRYGSTTADLCKLKVIWENGTVRNDRFNNENGNLWFIRKKEGEDSRYAEFTCRPKGSIKSFGIAVKTKFTDFSIYTPDGQPVATDQLISLENTGAYTYQISNIKVKMTLTVGSINDEEDADNKTYSYVIDGTKEDNGPIEVVCQDVKNRTTNTYSILAKSSLDALFGGISELRRLLYSSFQDYKHACIKFDVSANGIQYHHIIKRYPFTFAREEDDKICVKYNDDETVSLSGKVKALPLFRYKDIEPIDIDIDEDGRYTLTDAVREWEKVLLFSGNNEEVLPRLVDFTTDVEATKEENTEKYKTAYPILKNETLPNAMIIDETWERSCYWFNRCINEHIPSSSIWELTAITSSRTLLVRLVLCLLMDGLKENFWMYGEFLEKLKEKLQGFAKENAFEWFWLKPDDWAYIKFIQHLDEQSVMKYISLYEYTLKDEERKEFKENPMLVFLQRFDEFMKDLRITSFQEFILKNNIISADQAANLLEAEFSGKAPETDDLRYEACDSLNTLDANLEKAFEPFTVNEAPNFAHFMERANMLLANLKGDFDIFSKHYKVKKSVIYYTGHYIDSFLTLWSQETKNYK